MNWLILFISIPLICCITLNKKELIEWADLVRKKFGHKTMCIGFETREKYYFNDTKFECLFVNSIKQSQIATKDGMLEIEKWIKDNFDFLENAKFESFCPTESKNKYLNVYFNPGIVDGIMLWIRWVFRYIKIKKDYCN